MKDIRVNGELYQWYYEERDGSNWYIPKKSGDKNKAVNLPCITQLDVAKEIKPR